MSKQLFVRIFATYVLAKCIDKYIALKTQQVEDPSVAVKIDPRLEEVVQRMFQRCFTDGEYKQVRLTRA